MDARTKKLLLLILGVGLALRLCLLFAGGTFQSPERFEYDKLAQNLLDGKGYVCQHLGNAYRSFYSGIFYIGMTELCYALFPGRPGVILLVQSLLALLLALVVFGIGRFLWNERAGLLASFLTLTHPALVYYDTHKLHPLGLDTLTTSLAVLSLLWAREAGSWIPALLAGLSLGVGILQRGTLALLAPLGILWLCRFSANNRRLRLQTACVLLGMGLVLGPWLFRNFQIHRVWLIQTTSAEHFWIGNGPYASGSLIQPSGEVIVGPDISRALRSDLFALNERGQSQLFWESSLLYIRDHPWKFIKGLIRKFIGFWSFSPQTGLRYPHVFLMIYQVYYLALLGLAVRGFLRCRLVAAASGHATLQPTLVLILCAFASVSLLQSLFYVEGRHRWVIEPMLLLLSSVGLPWAGKAAASGWKENRYFPNSKNAI